MHEEGLDTPVLFLVFNRPDVTKRVFERIREVKPRQLYVAADGPRVDRPDDLQKCMAVREIATAVDWECAVKTLFSEENLGCGKAVSEAITWFFKHVEKGIILEDDCLPDLSFFPFCENLLNKYQEEEKIMHIGGHALGTLSLGKYENCFFSSYNHIWGWATWKRAWQKYDFILTGLNEFFDKGKLRYYFHNDVEVNYWQSTLNNSIGIDTWDYQWTYCIWKNEGVSILPKRNLVKNIGFNSQATHTKKKDLLVDKSTYGVISDPILPNKIEPNYELDQQMSNFIFNIDACNSPLTENSNTSLIKKISPEDVIKSYSDILDINVSKYFQDIPFIKLFKCNETGYTFFYPFTFAGNGIFYERLQKFDWYYNPWKWEHEETSQLIQKDDKVLEVGCAKGDFLATIKKHKQAIVCGLELNKKAQSTALDNGLDVQSEMIQNFAEKHSGEFDLVCSFQVLEHISDVKSFLGAKIKCLKKGGKLIIAVPNNDSFIKWDQGGILNFPPHHMGWWNKRSLESLQSIFNIKLDELKYEPLQPYHFQWYTRSWANEFLKFRLFKSIFYRLKMNEVFQLMLKKRANKIKGHSILAVYNKL